MSRVGESLLHMSGELPVRARQDRCCCFEDRQDGGVVGKEAGWWRGKEVHEEIGKK